MNKFACAVEYMWFKWLNRRGQRKSFNWEEFKERLKRFPLPRPRIVKGYSCRLGWENRRALDELAPETWNLPSRTMKRLDYEIGEIPIIAARLQEFFGCRQTPKVCGEPVMLHLLSPAGRPVQITRDLDGFWERAYPDVKRELMSRYPRHHWPDDPRVAVPTARAKRKRP